MAGAVDGRALLRAWSGCTGCGHRRARLYVRQFENDWVRIVRVHYPPYAKLPAHAHPAVACAYVYLNDSGPVVFKHAGADARDATRPPTKAGAFRVFRGIEELHGVENLSPLPSDFLRVEFKTDPKEPRTLRGKFFRETPPAGENLEKVQFENVQVRISRLVIAAGQQLDVRTTPQEPALLIALTPGSIEGEPAAMALVPGQERWMDTARAGAFATPAQRLWSSCASTSRRRRSAGRPTGRLLDHNLKGTPFRADRSNGLAYDAPARIPPSGSPRKGNSWFQSSLPRRRLHARFHDFTSRRSHHWSRSWPGSSRLPWLAPR